MNATQNFFMARTYAGHNHGLLEYVEGRFSFARTVEIKGVSLQLKKSGTEHAAEKNQFFNKQLHMAVHFLSEKFHLVHDELLMSYYLFILSSHQHVQHMTSQILLILIDFDRFFRHILI